MPAKRTAKAFAFYCDPCQLVFRVPREQLGNPSDVSSVVCFYCSRKARVERLPDGGIRVIHDNDRYVFICPRPLDNNPLIVVLAYVGGFAVLAITFAAVARTVHPALCPVVLLTAVLSIGVIGGIQLAIAGQLNKSYVDLVRVFVGALSNLLWRKAPQGIVVRDTGITAGLPKAVSA